MVFTVYALKSFCAASSLDYREILGIVKKGMDDLSTKKDIAQHIHDAGSVLLTAIENHKKTSDHFTARLFDETGHYIGGIHFSPTNPVKFQDVRYDCKKSAWRGTNIAKRTKYMENFNDILKGIN